MSALEKKTTIKKLDYALIRWLFLRGLSLIYFVAFLSLAMQINGLIGQEGILPAHQYLDEIASSMPGVTHFLAVPTLAWISSSDAFLQFLCWAGVVAALLSALDLCSGFFLGACWVLYLSLISVGQDFLSATGGGVPGDCLESMATGRPALEQEQSNGASFQSNAPAEIRRYGKQRRLVAGDSLAISLAFVSPDVSLRSC
jgi:hypothetical protein